MDEDIYYMVSITKSKDTEPKNWKWVVIRDGKREQGYTWTKWIAMKNVKKRKAKIT